MAAASMNDIKARMRSVNSTMQITKAMELVATSKLRRAKERAEASCVYRRILQDALVSLSRFSERAASVYTEKRQGGKTLYVVLAGDRGLAGGYNGNVIRLTREVFCAKENRTVIPLGKKALEFYERRGEEILTSAYSQISSLGVSDAMRLAREILDRYLSGEVTRVELVYTRFVSMMTVVPSRMTLLPITLPEETDDGSDPITDGDPDELLRAVIPDYLGGLLYSAITEAFASECASRRTAMNAASKNASEMIDSLSLSYNRARQAVITQEITEIVSGAEAL
ncbi:MAG: ATP synthase F1 subunit gamma [Lachnospiraceae bacterium]|nr:ATP synthase F1 subunit gamma [Lachnospiraceae bacterium]